MSSRFDIRVYKGDLRSRYRKVREGMSPGVKGERDRSIFRRLTAMPQYRKAKLVLCFVSTPIEVETRTIINHALSQGKRVAVPYCVPGTRRMEFYRIRSLDDLSPRTFGVLEPDPERGGRVSAFGGSICILPGLAFDRQGYRLGYGGGYYDRFLSTVYKGGTTVGVCYQDCTRRRLVHGRYDIPCQWLVTDTGTYRVGGYSHRKKVDKGKSP